MSEIKLDPCRFGNYEDRAKRSYREDPTDRNCTVQAVCLVDPVGGPVEKSPISKETIVVTDAVAVALTVPADTCSAIAQFNIICSRFCVDGSIATSGAGYLLGDGAIVELSKNDLAGFSAIAESGFGGQIIITYYEEI